jgi:phage-related protein
MEGRKRNQSLIELSSGEQSSASVKLATSVENQGLQAPLRVILTHAGLYADKASL